MEKQIFEAKQRGDLDLACATSEEASRLFPQELRFLYEAAIFQRRTGKTGKAVNSAKLLVKKEPQNKWFWRELAVSNMERGFTKKALSACHRAYDMGARDYDFLLIYAHLCYEFGYYDRGKEVITKSLEQKARWEAVNGPELMEMLLILCEMTYCIDPARMEPVWKQMRDIIECNSDQLSAFMPDILFGLSVLERQFDNTGEAYEQYKDFSLFLISVTPGKKERETMQLVLESFRVGNFMEDERFSLNARRLIGAWITKRGMSVSGEIEIDPWELRMEETEAKLFLLKEPEKSRDELLLISSCYPEFHDMIQQNFVSLFSDEKQLVREREQLLQYYRKEYDYLVNTDNSYFDVYPEDRFAGAGRVISSAFTEKPFVRLEKKIGRNDPCPCGSGKKYKQCCMKR